MKMNRKILEHLYTLRRNLQDQLDHLEKNKLNPVSADDNSFNLSANTKLHKTEQLTMINSLIDMIWEGNVSDKIK